MLLPCESIIKLILPAIRAGVTKELYKKHKLSQVEIAKKLGITQAAVSKYLSGDYGKGIKELEKTKEIKETIKNVCENVVLNKKGIKGSICECCTKVTDGSCELKIGDE